VIDANPLTISCVRSLIATLFFCLVFAAKGKLAASFRLNKAGWAIAVSYAIVMTCFVTANKLTTAANAIFLQYTMPAWVLVGGAIWLQERITRSRLFSVALCVIGMVLFFQGELQPTDWSGNVVALCSGFFFAVMTLLFRYDREQNVIAAVMMGNLLTAVTNLPFALWLAPSDFMAFPGYAAMLSLLWLGVFQISIAYMCYTFALRGLPAIEVALLMLIEPVLNPSLVFFTLGESPSIWSILGGAVIVLSVFVRIVFVREKNGT
jgi:drug/metabolite transporter (DMT)-like permease